MEDCQIKSLLMPTYHPFIFTEHQMVLLGRGRGASAEKWRFSAVQDSGRVRHESATPRYRHTAAKLPQRTLVSSSLSQSQHIRIVGRLRRWRHFSFYPFCSLFQHIFLRLDFATLTFLSACASWNLSFSSLRSLCPSSLPSSNTESRVLCPCLVRRFVLSSTSPSLYLFPN